MARKKAESRKVAVIDYETDPFKYGRIPKPFVAGFYDGEIYRDFWGDDCVQQLVDWLTYDAPHAYLIYAHNGGKFDFFLMLDHLENPVKIINGRIVSAKLGRHELRDSFAIIPIGLAGYQKEKIDYDTFERETREAHSDAIRAYLRSDCLYLYDLVAAFVARFTAKITVGSTAIGELRKFHPFEQQREWHDAKFRPFYFGGRVEALESGVLEGDWKVIDVNSMYPYVMSELDHPTGREYLVSYSTIMDKKGRMSGHARAPFYFAHIECHQSGAFPTRVKDGPLNFDVPHGEFFVTSHELKAALDTGRVSGVKVRQLWVPLKTIRFKEFVAHFMAEKIRGKETGDKIGELFAKFMLNSAYGKFGTNPDNYKDYWLQGQDEPIPPEPYQIASAHNCGVNLWEKDATSKRYFDVATAASITGAARSVLLRALSAAIRPVYCDTDSIICQDTGNIELDPSRLGAWKLEARGERLAVAGKKLYALHAARTYPELPKQEPGYVKVASKGVRLTGATILDLARGGVAEWENMAPSFSLTKKPSFVKRKIVAKNL
jgi:hypothetical protein